MKISVLTYILVERPLPLNGSYADNTTGPISYYDPNIYNSYPPISTTLYSVQNTYEKGYEYYTGDDISFIVRPDGELSILRGAKVIAAYPRGMWDQVKYIEEE